MKQHHPVLRERGFIAMTAPLGEFCDVVNDHVAHLESSLVAIGTQRTGKTTALLHLERTLRDSRQAAFFGAHTINSKQQRWLEPRFWRSFLERSPSAESSFRVKSNYDAFIGAIRTACDRIDSPRVVIALDEAQKMNLEMYDLLKQLNEALFDLDLQPFFLLMAQPDINVCIDDLRVMLRHDFVDRFLASSYRFRGSREGELAQFLRHYDSNTWPQGSTLTYTAHFAPRLWQRGWRLEHEAQPLWDSFVTLASSIGVETRDLELGTKYLVKAVRTILMALEEGASKTVDHKLLYKAAQGSGYAQVRLVVGDAEAAAQQALDDAVAARTRKRLAPRRRPRV
jgi:hypothetical protein